jgi:hypothetical protein
LLSKIILNRPCAICKIRHLDGLLTLFENQVASFFFAPV